MRRTSPWSSIRAGQFPTTATSGGERRQKGKLGEENGSEREQVIERERQGRVRRPPYAPGHSAARRAGSVATSWLELGRYRGSRYRRKTKAFCE